MISKLGNTEGVAAETTPRFELKVHLGALIEIATLLGVAVAIDLIYRPGIVASFKPHPFWIPVLLVSLQYGTVDGLVAVSAATLALWFLGWPQAQPSEDHVAYLSRVWSEPLLWLGTAVLVGEFRLRELAELRGLRAKLSQLAAGAKYCAARSPIARAE